MQVTDQITREKYWREKVERWQISGLNLRQFANANNLHYKALSRWKVTFLGAAPVAKPNNIERADFAPVHIIQPGKEGICDQSLTTPVELLFGNGRTLRFDQSCSLEFLSSLIPLVEANTNV